jgi:hypothetical protein
MADPALSSSLRCALAWAALWTGLAAATDQPAPRLETLFYSSAERNAVVRQRQGLAPHSPGSQLRLNGIVLRSGGRSTVWINQRPLVEGQPVTATAPSAVSARTVTVDGQKLRVGQTLDLNTRQRSDIVDPGALTRKENP